MQTLVCHSRRKFYKVVSNLHLVLGVLVVLLSLSSLVKLYSAGFILNDVNLCKPFYASKQDLKNSALELSSKLEDIKQQVEEIQSKIGKVVEEMREKGSEGPKVLESERLKYNTLLVEILPPLDAIKLFLEQLRLPGVYLEPENENANGQIIDSFKLAGNTKERLKGMEDFFHIEEIRKYITVKENRLGKKNFLGANATFTSIGHACLSMKEDLEEYMGYDIGDYCNDDWNVAQRLMVHGCDPLPRRRCLARAPKYYQKPFPINESLWKLPDDRNVRWSHYQCKNFTCLANNKTRKGFYKCAECFNLTQHELPKWMEAQNTSSNQEFLISDILNIKPGEIRIGLDFSVGSGTFAARMREFNVTIVSATMNLGAPFNEIIALRGLVPLYITINQRLPFFDNTLDLIHTSRFLDSWIDLQFLDFVIFDWDRVLRPGGLLWIDGFFCTKMDLDDYLYIFLQLRYKKHKWMVVPKKDKDDKEVYFSAVLEKPPRPF
ncbi:hypothetical protein SUGI_0916400 [Cryptomeria japonica]|uniref:probable methyltransferase At1g29790 n=1 Tax=Cryptomeria japonica TaxID=3369 RepID=UPI0024149D8B|nr:probable methyltransferase At1g29790 [Cryptomeria japonica]XP_059067248.1 probable methyltransferase At1g29790 [Cryptomeria japonica]GLJ43959.1 hypothetical protein SUGI_0916400 [Cryptomeria japonica]